MISPSIRAYRGTLLHFTRDPGDSMAAPPGYVEDGLLVVEDGKVNAAGPAVTLLPTLPAGVPLTDYSRRLILPGFIDAHVHYVQTDVIATYASQLLDWLEDHTFPAERRFEDPAHAEETARFFLDEMLRNGTTTAMIFGSVHSASIDAFFGEASRRKLRMIAGKSLMDRNCPDYLRDTAESGHRDSSALIEKWDGHDRLHYAITPRFAATSTPEQLTLAGKLAREHPDTFIQSHVAENVKEVEWVRSLFPEARSYLDVYDRFGLLRERAVYAHCIYLDGADRKRMAQAGAIAAACPTSNLFLGSGLFDFSKALAAGMRVALATDVGGGTSFSMLRTLSEAYKVAQMRGYRLTPWRAFYLATLAGAEALKLEDRIGSFRPGREADFIVLRMDSTPLIARRIKVAKTPAEKLFALMMLGDDREVGAAYILGKRVAGTLIY